MSLAWCIVFEKEIPGFDPFVNGKSIARAGEALDSIAKKLGLQPLMEFFGASPEELAAFAESEGIDLREQGSFPAERWYSAQKGLETVNALIESAAIQNLPHSDKIIDDLKEFARVLEVAMNHGVGWHLAVDF